MLATLKEYFNNQGLQYSQGTSDNIFFLGFYGENGNFMCIAEVEEDENKFSFFTILGINTPVNKRMLMAELLVRLNNIIFFGNLNMDFEDGEIRFKTSLLYQSVKVTEKLIDNLIVTNVATMDRFLPAMTGLIFNDLSPVQAYGLFDKNDQNAS